MRKLLSRARDGLKKPAAAAKSAMFKTKRRKYGILAGAALILAAAILVQGRGSGKDTSFLVAARDYSETVVASGVLTLEEETDLIAEVAGEVESVHAQNGDEIAASSVLISIASQNNLLDLDAAKAVYDNARSRYDQVVSVDYPAAAAELTYRNAQKEQAEKEYRDAQTLFSEGAISQNDLKDKQIQMDSARSQWSAASLRLQSLGGSGALRASALSDLETARIQYEKAETQAGNYEIEVPWDAVLLKAHVEPLDRVEPGQLLARIGKQGGYYVTTELDEKYFPYLNKDKKVTISVGDGRMGAMPGRIAGITPAIDPATGTFEVKIGIPSDFPYQASGLSVNIDIVLLQIPDALVIPAAYIVMEEGQAYALLQAGSSHEKQRVEVTRGAGSDLVVTAGLSAGQTIVLPSGGDATDGD